MPTVEKTSGGRVHVRDIAEFVPGEQVEVSGDDAEYLCAERGDFEVVDESESYPTESDESVGCGVTPSDADGGYLRDAPAETQVAEGVCPWCSPNDRYEGDHVGQHASSAHPDEWDAFKED